jgi:hypothetical protein
VTREEKRTKEELNNKPVMPELPFGERSMDFTSLMNFL